MKTNKVLTLKTSLVKTIYFFTEKLTLTIFFK